MNRKKKAIILTSGGLDSATALAIAENQCFELFALTFEYGQRHKIEIEKAKDVALSRRVTEHLILNIALDKIGGSALTSNIPVPKEGDNKKTTEEIPITYVPARNIIFLSYAISWGEVIGAYDIFIGANAVDYSGYPDCRPDFISSFEKMANIGTKSGVEGSKFTIHTPLIAMTKADIIKMGHKLDVDYGITSSCYDPFPDGKPCGLCDSCVIRKKGFMEAGLKDPLTT